MNITVLQRFPPRFAGIGAIVLKTTIRDIQRRAIDAQGTDPKERGTLWPGVLNLARAVAQRDCADPRSYQLPVLPGRLYRISSSSMSVPATFPGFVASAFSERAGGYETLKNVGRIYNGILEQQRSPPGIINHLTASKKQQKNSIYYIML